MNPMVSVQIWRPLCPHCGADSGVSLEGRFNSQPKDDWMHGCRCRACGKNFSVTWKHETQTLTLEKLETRNAIPIFCLFMLKVEEQGKIKPLYLTVADNRYGDPEVVIDHKEEWEQKRYFYEEHTCPTNFIRIHQFMIDGDTDPHGLLKFLDFVDAKDAVFMDKDRHYIDTKATWPHLFQEDVVDMGAVVRKLT